MIDATRIIDEYRKSTPLPRGFNDRRPLLENDTSSISRGLRSSRTRHFVREAVDGAVAEYGIRNKQQFSLRFRVPFHRAPMNGIPRIRGTILWSQQIH